MTTQRETRQSETRMPSGDDVAHRAYELFQMRGGEPGHDLDDWLQAERELSGRPPSEAPDRSRPDVDAVIGN